ncbi:MAG: hypothetical protein IJV41_02495 [Oscillospiraceae bacterium]|nr:hypothetical protein [Parasporobacterium sp.]MBQ9685404.1 hypothetical protein [Oscillospiraceae bacterium]
MLTFELNINDRKKLIKKVSEMTGQEAIYLQPPTYAYQIGDYNIDRDGNLSVEEDKADLMMLMQLMGEGFLKEKAIGTAAGEVMPVSVNIEIPLSGHTGASLRNLINLVHSRASLINKATGSEFFIDKGITDLLADDGNVGAIDVLKKVVKDYVKEHPGAMKGFELADDRICFTGFPDFTDTLTLKAWMDLASLMNKQAIDQHRIQAKTVSEANEKYSFRIWLIRLGMNGDEYKRTRKILMKRLGGHSAFRTPEEIERAKEKALRKRRELKAAKEAALAEGAEEMADEQAEVAEEPALEAEEETE